MIYFFLNLFLALAWMLLNGDYTSVNFIVGFVVGFFALRLSQPFGLETSYFRRFRSLISLLLYFCYEMMISVAKVVWDVITPTHLSDPDIVYVPLDVESDLEISLLANMVSLTPGSLSLDVTSDKKYMVVHAMFAPEHQKVIREIKDGLEKRILEVTRG
ncbi:MULTISPECIES: Na+/H+ antiporter subunit E [Vibrio]|uniref:Na+/H+ antiporter subunit E n=1 Tax=Vibrio TaxID=662 RepID=UPI001EFC681A|nr:MULTISPECIES: Na+/H+ antiporter subunit E [Vibrio]MCG9677622.1 Na+/H+ antiporter subunit E [Vibrio sp. Isolate24]USD34485.1 Na+/H+ antiporter subunit E [Vibrio sp. SCSIO 43186]USD47555.1 Na+/H+ antiporter subunit E [Vibrio sp. SCSIO 43145]USD71610.1 Na+/H+ antiporter subunit E [Vibrio sp. SCSIO 43139]USD98514.1 sodium:proton antiporter [Vibrio coralliilyticus]